MSTIDTMDTARLWSLGGCCTVGKFLIGASKAEADKYQVIVPHPLDLEGISNAINECVVMNGLDLTSAKGVGIIAIAPEYFLQDENISTAIKYTFSKAKEIIGDGLIFTGQYDDNSVSTLEFYLFFNGLKYPEERFNQLWEDIKTGRAISQKKQTRLETMPYDIALQSSGAGQNFNKLKQSALGSQDVYDKPSNVPNAPTTKASKVPCNNCFVVNGVSMGVYKKGGPKPFTGKICPVCNGRGKI